MSYYIQYPVFNPRSSYIQAVVTHVSHPNTALVDITEIRKDLRLFGDTSRDTEVRSYILAAQENIGKKLDRPIASTTVVDYYRCIGEVMELYHNCNTTSTIKVEYYNKDDELVIFETIANRDTVGTNIFIDRSGSSYSTRVNLTKAGETAIKNISYSETRANPVQITYTSESFANEGEESMKIAVRKYVNSIWGDTGPVVKQLAKADMERLIAPYIRVRI